MHYTVLLFIRAPFYVLLVFVAMCSFFWLFWLSCHYLPSDWLERPLWGSLTVTRGSSPESPGRRVRMIVVSCPYVIYYPTVMARYSLFVLKVPLNTKQANKQNKYSAEYGDIWMVQKCFCYHCNYWQHVDDVLCMWRCRCWVRCSISNKCDCSSAFVTKHSVVSYVLSDVY